MSQQGSERKHKILLHQLAEEYAFFYFIFAFTVIEMQC